MDLSIIIPTYNEAKNLDELVPLINNSLQTTEYELIIVDDNSPDGTGKIAEKLSDKYPLRTIHRNRKMGLATAVMDGFKIAKGDLFCVMDADLSHPPEKITEMIDFLKKGNADIVVGSRLIEGGRIEKWPFIRRLISFCAKCLVRPLTSIKDPMSGFFIIKRNVLKNTQLKPLGYKILLEILVKGRYKKIIEYPFVFKNRTNGKTKLDTKTVFYYFVHVVRLYYYSLFSKKHAKVFK